MTRRHGILLYTAADAARNRWFIRRMCDCAEPEGISLRLCISDDGFLLKKPYPDFVINRTRNAEFSEACEDIPGICVYNSVRVTEITNDKYRTHLFLRENGLPTADTVLVHGEGDVPEDFQPPLIAKPADGHGGAGVTLLRDAAALSKAMREMPRPFLLQKQMRLGWDTRVYVMGGEIYAAVLRTSASDFRSNFSLGGRAEMTEPDRDMRELVSRVQAVLPMDFAGVDFLRTPEGGYVIGEIEDAVGCRMLYALSGLDPAADFIRMIARRLRSM
ncbi:MAG: ATP-grasp domain-containing protein [Oscillospiraceae bacterium]|nr:ATP-grasp domain-containing protein [Oscillospiraceae bacterium]